MNGIHDSDISLVKLSIARTFLRTVLILLLLAGCGKQEEDASCGDAASDSCGALALEKKDEDAHGSIEEIAHKHCEHDIPIYSCDGCRYEVGIVKVEPRLFNKGLLKTRPVILTNAYVAIRATGEIALNENATVHISPRVAGIVDTVSADVGMRVKKDETLLTLTSVELGRALAEYERNRTLTELAEKVFKREAKLREEKVGSEQDKIDAQMIYEKHRAEFQASEQMLRVLGFDVEGSDTDVTLPIRTPLAGTVISKHAVSGELVEPGQEIMIISDIRSVWVWANIYSRDLESLIAAHQQKKASATITVSAFPKRPFAGTIDYIGAIMDENTRTVKVRLSTSNPDRLLRPGMFCNIEIGIQNSDSEKRLAVPQSALFSSDDEAFVFMHWKEDYYARKMVRTGQTFQDMIEVFEGLHEGASVVSEGGFLLKSDVLRAQMGAGCVDN